MNASSLYAGIETGGTKILVRVADALGVPQIAGHFATGTPEQAVADILSCLGQDAIRSRLAAVGMASFGPIRLDPAAPDYGRIVVTTKPGWSGFDLRGALHDALGIPVAVDTDVNCAARAELSEGAGCGLPSLAYVTVGTGIGAGLGIGAATLQDALHPEIGHLRLVRAAGDDVPSTCPYHSDCAEGLAAGPAVRRRLGPGVRLEDRPHTFALIAHYLGQLCASVALAWAPHRIAVGGGVLAVPGLREAILPAMVTSLAGYGPSDLLDRPNYLVAPKIDDAGLAGALGMARAAANGATAPSHPPAQSWHRPTALPPSEPPYALGV